MLILTRREGGRILIGGEGSPLIVVTVTHIGGNQVRLGVEAPDSVKVFREEIAPLELLQELRKQGDGK